MNNVKTSLSTVENSISHTICQIISKIIKAENGRKKPPILCLLLRFKMNEREGKYVREAYL